MDSQDIAHRVASAANAAVQKILTSEPDGYMCRNTAAVERLEDAATDAANDALRECGLNLRCRMVASLVGNGQITFTPRLATSG